MPNKIVYEDKPTIPEGYAVFNDAASDQQKNNNTDVYGASNILSENATRIPLSSLENRGISCLTDAKFYVNSDSGNIGFVSEYASDANGNFAYLSQHNPILRVDFANSGQPYFVRSAAVKVYFTNAGCDWFIVHAITGNNTSIDITVTDANIRGDGLCVVSDDRLETTKICGVSIEFVHSVEPHSFAEVYKIEFGIDREITDFFSISLNKAIDPITSDISVGSLDVRFLSDTKLRFDENQKLRLYHWDSNESCTEDSLIGTYWLTDSERQTNKIYSISAVDTFGILDNASLSSDTQTTIGALIDEMSANSIISQSCDFDADAEYLATEITGNTKNASYRRILAECNLIGNSIAVCKPNGDIEVFEAVTDDPTPLYTITESEIVGETSYTNNKLVTSLEYTAKDASGESVSYTASVDLNANELALQKSVSRDLMLDGQDLDENAQEYAERIFNLYRTYPGELKLKTTRQGVKLGDFIAVNTAYNGTMQGYVTKMDADVGSEVIIYDLVVIA